MFNPDKAVMGAEFARRLNTACDVIPLVPPAHYGRLTWFKKRLEEHTGEKVSLEAVRKWFSGASVPTPDKLKKIAAVLEADEAWLSLGLAPDLSPREQKLRNATADGAVNVVAGFIQMDGGHPAFPAAGDKRAEDGHIDIYAIIKGAQYAFHVVLGQTVGDAHRFTVPANWQAALQIGVVPGPELSVRLTEIPEEAIEAGVRRGGMIEVTMTDADIEQNRIRTFSKRL